MFPDTQIGLPWEKKTNFAVESEGADKSACCVWSVSVTNGL